MTRPGILPEIQALRALAVSLVVIFHLWPGRLTGGYVGVDVFFVISGYLITAHLLREVDATGRVELSRFYARRIRRLLPAAFAVLLASLVAVLVFVPASLWRQFTTEIGASALYVVNWVLAFNSVDYFAEANRPSPVRHYWSLAVEEQFYLVWPLLIIAALWLARGRGSRAVMKLLATMFTVVFVTGLAYSVVGARVAQPFTYFATPAHAWEFAAGGLLALALAAGGRASHFIDRVRDAPVWAPIVSVAGFAFIIASSMRFDAQSAFPGWIALVPVVGALAVIAAGSPNTRWFPRRVIASRPIQFVGDVSYSAYLWHWPLIVIAPLALERDLAVLDKMAILGATVLLAWVSKRWIEDPVRLSARLAPRRRSFGWAAALTVILVGGCVVPVVAHESGVDAVKREIAATTDDDCFGARALREGAECAFALGIDPRFGADPKLYRTSEMDRGDKECVRLGEEQLRRCSYGSTTPDKTIALVGDSHINHYSAGFRELARTNDWRFEFYTRNACPPVVTTWSRTDSDNRESLKECSDWRNTVIRYLAESKKIDLIVVSSYTQKYSRLETAENRARLARSYAETWREWTDAGIPVLVIADNPLTSGTDVQTCVAQNLDDPTVCGMPRDEAVGNDALVAAAKEFENPGVDLLDLTDSYCDDARCYVAVGGILAYADSNHVSIAWAASMAPYVGEAMKRNLSR